MWRRTASTSTLTRPLRPVFSGGEDGAVVEPNNAYPVASALCVAAGGFTIASGFQKWVIGDADKRLSKWGRSADMEELVRQIRYDISFVVIFQFLTMRCLLPFTPFLFFDSDANAELINDPCL
jgi:hypothetical protein